MKKLVLSLVIVIFVAGCIQHYGSEAPAYLVANISSFSELPNKLIGKKIHVLAYPSEKNDTLEWKSYLKKIESGFKKAGLEIGSIGSADYVAFISYGIDSGKTKKDLVSTPIYGSTGGGTTYHSGTYSTYGGGYGSYSGTSYSMPTYGVIGSSASTVSGEVFTRNIAVDIVLRETLKDKKPTKVYEGRLRSAGSCSQMKEVIDEMVEGFFQKFPMGSGKVVIPSIADC